MKIKTGLTLVAAVAALQTAAFAQESKPAAAATAATNPGNEVLPFIQIEDTPLQTAIQNMARMADVNIQFDPKVFGSTDPKQPQAGQQIITLRWTMVTPMQALNGLLDNHGLQLVTDPKSGIARVTTKDPKELEPLVPKVIFLRYSHPTNMIPLIKGILGTRSSVLADTRTSQLVVVATEKEQTVVETLVGKMDSPPAQVLIEARFIQTAQAPKSLRGIDWEPTFSGHRVSFGNRGTNALGSFGAGWDTINGWNPAVGVLGSDGINAVINFLNSDDNTETIATPRAVALDGVQTELSVVQNVPIFEQQQGANTGGTQNPNTVKANYELTVGGTIINEVGTKLVVTPRIYGGSNVFLSLRPEISARGVDEKQTVGGTISSSPTFFRRKITTEAMVASGYTLVLGGLREDTSRKISTQVPILGDAPGFGGLFRNKNKSRDKRDLLIFVTPSIITVDDFVPGAEARDFLKQKVIDKPDAPWGMMDSAEPKDWSLDWSSKK